MPPQKAVPPNLVALARAAEEIGCHVGTLRRSIREGRLDATRGPRATLYLSARDVRRLTQRPPRRGRPRSRRPRVTPETIDAAWRWVEGILSHQDRELEYVLWVAEDPSRDRQVYRYALSHGLLGVGIPPNPIAEVVGISARHVRRLLWRPMQWGLRGLMLKRLAARERQIRLRAMERTLARVRLRLERDGVRAHIPRFYSRGNPWHPVKPFRVKPAITPLTAAQLRDAGLTHAEIEAVFQLGLPAEELNELLLRGSRSRRRDRRN